MLACSINLEPLKIRNYVQEAVKHLTLVFKDFNLPLLWLPCNMLQGHCTHLKRFLNKTDSLPGEHVTRFFHLVTWNMMFYIRFVYPGLNVDNLLPVIIRYGGTVYLIWQEDQMEVIILFFKIKALTMLKCFTKSYPLLIVICVSCNFTCIVLFFISNTEHRLHSPVRFADAVAAAHMPDYRGQQGRSEHYSHTR